MTSKQLFEIILIELNKVKSPSLLLDDFNYFANKAIGQYVNKGYNLYEINQQKSDDLRALKIPNFEIIPTLSTNSSALFTNVYKVDLPTNYLHILNCIVEYTLDKKYKCNNKDEKLYIGAKRLTSDMFPQLLNNYYMKPSWNNPYFYLTNNESSEMEIRYGKDASIFKLTKVFVDYLKKPKIINLTEEQLDDFMDNSDILEFPDYVCQEIVNELVKLVMENGSDPRLQTNIPINQSIMGQSK